MKTWFLALALITMPPSSVLAQSPAGTTPDGLTRAKSLYAAANFEGALQILESLKGPAATSEAGAYQVYCLVALGRLNDARTVVERIVRADPLFRPANGEVAPRVRAFFDDARKPVLLDVARQSFAKAKVAFNDKDMTSATAQFDRVIAVLDEIGGTDPNVTDLRTVAVAFRDLSRFVPEPPPPPKPSPTPTSPASNPLPKPELFASTSRPVAVATASVTPPVAIKVPLPDWRPNIFELNRTFSGEIELVLDEKGNVLSASMLTGVHPRYDPILLEAAKSWTFKPATRNGVPIPYRYIMTVQVLR